MAKSKFFRVAVEGPTVDGREIKREWLEQCAANYALQTYTARINCSHIVGLSGLPPFNAYGSVVSLKTQEVELTIGGEKKTLLGLYAEIDANDQLIDLNKAGQKLFTSCEIHPNFAGTGEAYLVGLAVTDQPASLGTEPLKFAALSRANLFTNACETQIEILAAPLDSDAIGKSIGESILAFFKKEKKEEPAPPPAHPKPANDNGFDVAAFATAFGASVADQIAAATKPANDAVAAIGADLAALTARLETTERPGSFTRALATGGNAAIVTDC
ncbi:GPO family capsid scaffolding protein [Sphingobium sp. BYY-5]|uniref:GPO family capsid scaffolding protein n=1 Tax=Sphingobium sp. BYY-5 TaxID=2926400 RepID=UPI001FA76201|nr:GPO family capsid scaffolding protein [Sphingobium sp. BYY-5]MCI4588627.1 GPO family capsid scaffolding protein [Sphingobium sp. BYY-5]